MVAAQDAGVKVYSWYKARTAHIETIGVLYNGSEEVTAGSGLLIGNRHVLTNNHVIPRTGNYQNQTINIRLRSRSGDPIVAEVLLLDRERDLALLELKAPAVQLADARCPVPAIEDAAHAPPGTTIYLMGFPLNYDLTITSGVVSNHGADGGNWLTDTTANPGNSGGPAFDGRGALVGLAVGGATYFNEERVSGINFLIPVKKLVESDIYEFIDKLPDAVRCWTIMTAATSAPYRTEPQLPPESLNRSFGLSETKDDHPVVFAPHSRSYEKRFKADRGYRITECSLTPVSANNAHDVGCSIGPDRSEALVRFRLESGPAVDRWRGWWKGTVDIRQIRNREINLERIP